MAVFKWPTSNIHHKSLLHVLCRMNEGNFDNCAGYYLFVWTPHESNKDKIQCFVCGSLWPLSSTNCNDWLHEPRDPPCNIQLQTSFFKPKDSFTYPVLHSTRKVSIHFVILRVLDKSKSVYFLLELGVHLHMCYTWSFVWSNLCIPKSYKDRGEHISCRSCNQSMCTL